MKWSSLIVPNILKLNLADLQSVRIKQFAEYWQSKRSGAQMPERDNIDASELTELWPHLSLSDIDPKPLRVFHSLVKGRTVQAFSPDSNYLTRIGNDRERRDRTGMRGFLEESWDKVSPIFGACPIWSRSSQNIGPMEFGIFPVALRGVPTACFIVEDWMLEHLPSGNQVLTTDKLEMVDEEA